jgi:RHS repeat-associated protein
VKGAPPPYQCNELDEETNLYYFGARYLDAQTSRWLSCDPVFVDYLPTTDKEKNKELLGQGGIFNPVNISVYHYAGNNPIKYIDPNGETILPTSIYYFNKFHQNEFLEKHNINLGNSNITVERYGCKLVSITRIANAINWEENGMAMGDAIESNSIGVENGIFSGANLNGAAAVENLIEAITDVDVTATNVSGTENIRNRLTELSDSNSEDVYVMGAYRVGNGSHYVNIEGIDGDNAILYNSFDGGRSSIPIADLTLITVVEVD